MDRLTARNQAGLAYLVNVKPNEQAVDSEYPNTLRCILESFKRLAAYEDTGLTPEEINALKSGCDTMIKENADLLAENAKLLSENNANDRAIIELNDENANLRAELERSKEIVQKYATSARAIALWLNEFCNDKLPYDEMIAEAARKASAEIEQVRAEREAAIICNGCELKNTVGCHCAKALWRGKDGVNGLQTSTDSENI
jgi:predicted nuclease with TOPRIM domain